MILQPLPPTQKKRHCVSRVVCILTHVLQVSTQCQLLNGPVAAFALIRLLPSNAISQSQIVGLVVWRTEKGPFFRTVTPPIPYPPPPQQPLHTSLDEARVGNGATANALMKVKIWVGTDERVAPRLSSGCVPQRAL